MSDTKWTPGPWRIVETGDGFQYIGSPESIEMTGHVPSYWKNTVACEMSSEANAHLIAASPDLYAALVEVVDALEAKCEQWDEWCGSVTCAKCGPAAQKIEAARAALAKARGEQA